MVPSPREPVGTSSALSVSASWTPIPRWDGRTYGHIPDGVPLVLSSPGPEPVPFRSVYEVAFGTPTSGYALVQRGSHLGLARTTDGGRQWALLAESPRFGTPAASQVLLGRVPPPVIEADGPANLVAYEGGQVAVSSDGGRHWQDRQLPGEVRSAAAVGHQLWALVESRQSISPPYPPPPPPERLYVSTDGGGRWTERSALRGTLGPYTVLAPATPAVAYALAPGEDNSNAGYFGGLVRTADVGHHWEKVVSPCSGVFYY